MDDKIKLGISADASKADAEINKLNRTQKVFTESTQRANDAMKLHHRQVGDVRAYERYKAALNQTRGEIEHTRKELDSLANKQRQKVTLTQAETLALETNSNTVSRLNEKREKGIKLSLSEENQLIRATATVNKLTQKKEQHYQLTAKEQAAVNKLTSRLSSLESKERAQARTLDSVNDRLKVAGINTENLSIARSVANRRAEKAALLLERENRLLSRSNDLQARKKAVLDSMPDARLVGAGILATGALAGRVAMNNQAEFIDVAKNIDFSGGLGGEEAKQFRRELNRIASEMAGVSPDDVMRIAAGGANGGIAKNDLAAYTRDTIMSSTAWDMSAEDAAVKGMALRNSMNYGAGEDGRAQYLRMANMINDVANKNGGVYARDLLGVMSRTGALMVNSGFSEDQALALSGALLSKGASEEQAATATKNISSRLTAGFAATTAQQNIYSMIGTDAETVAAGMQSDAMGTLLDVLDGIKDLNKEDQSAAISQLFGEEANAHVQKLLKDTQSLRKIQIEAAHASNQSVENEYKGIASGYKSGYEETRDEINRLGVAFGDRLLPVIEPVRRGFTAIVSGMADFAEENETTTTTLIGVAGAVASVYAAKKVLDGFRFARTIAGIVKESAALRKQASATDKAARSADNLTRSMNRFSRSAGHNGRGGGGFGGASGGRRGRHFGKAGLFAAGLGLLGFAAPSFAGDSAAAIGAAGDVSEGLGMAKAAKASRFLRPLSMVLDGVNIVGSLMDGDLRGATETGGGLVGGLGGAAGGAALGTMILPGIGTAIGAGLGGLLGDEVVTRLVSAVFDWFSKDELPDKTEEIKLAQEKTAAAKMAGNLAFSPVIRVEGVSDPEKAAALTMEQMQTLFAEFLRERGLDSEMMYQDLNHSLMG